MYVCMNKIHVFELYEKSLPFKFHYYLLMTQFINFHSISIRVRNQAYSGVSSEQIATISGAPSITSSLTIPVALGTSASTTENAL